MKDYKLRKIISETIHDFLNEDKEFVGTMDFCYKGKSLYSVGCGDSFCYLPCDIYGTPKMYYGDSHFSCADQALEDIIHSFYGGSINNILNDDEINSITESLWIECIKEPGRMFFKKYIVVGFNGHIPSCDYIKDVMECIGGNPKDYSVVYNKNHSVKEINCYDFINGNMSDKQKPNKLKVPEELKKLYDNMQGRQSVINNKFPKNMTRAEYYSYMRQEGKRNKKSNIIV